MNITVKRILIALSGLIYGGISLYWDLFAFVFLIPDCTPDSKEWEEYTLCLPIGITMLALWLVLTASILYKLRKSKALIFFIAMIIGAAILWNILQDFTYGSGPFALG